MIFPQSILPLAVGRDSTVRLLNENGDSADFIGVVTQKDATIESPTASDLHAVGTSVRIHKSVRMPDGSIRLVVQGGFRFNVLKITQVTPYIRADIEIVESLARPEDAIEIDALTRNVHSVFSKIVEMSPSLADEVGSLAATLNDPGRLADFVAQNLPSLDTESRQRVLEVSRVKDRLTTVHEALQREQEVLEVGNKIESQVKNEVGRTQREYYLREQMKAIQKELGESDENAKDIDELRLKIQEAKMPEEAEERGGARAQPACQDSAGLRGVHRGTHLSRLARKGAVVEENRRRLRHSPRERHSRSGPLRSRKGQRPHPRVSRGPQDKARHQGPDPLLRRPSGRRQDEPGKIDRQSAWTQVPSA